MNLNKIALERQGKIYANCGVLSGNKPRNPHGRPAEHDVVALLLGLEPGKRFVERCEPRLELGQARPFGGHDLGGGSFDEAGVGQLLLLSGNEADGLLALALEFYLLSLEVDQTLEIDEHFAAGCQKLGMGLRHGQAGSPGGGLGARLRDEVGCQRNQLARCLGIAPRGKLQSGL